MTFDAEHLRIVTYPDPILTRRAEPVAAVNGEVRAVARRMLELMHDAEGLGLAAPQVGLGWRLFVTRGDEDVGEPDRVYINPTLDDVGGEMVRHEEGCLSLPGVTGEILRPSRVTITATGLDGEPFTLTSDAFIARVWQHEHDHLEGILIMKRMSPIDRLGARKALKELAAAADR